MPLVHTWARDKKYLIRQCTWCKVIGAPCLHASRQYGEMSAIELMTQHVSSLPFPSCYEHWLCIVTDLLYRKSHSQDRASNSTCTSLSSLLEELIMQCHNELGDVPGRVLNGLDSDRVECPVKHDNLENSDCSSVKKAADSLTWLGPERLVSLWAKDLHRTDMKALWKSWIAETFGGRHCTILRHLDLNIHL
jgi:hypothetical protein